MDAKTLAALLNGREIGNEIIKGVKGEIYPFALIYEEE